MKNKEYRMKNLAWLSGLGVFVLCVAFLLLHSPFFILHSSQNPSSSSASSTASALTQSYTNNAYHFSLMMPADFAATESQDPSSGTDTIVLQNTTGDGVQIVVSAFDEDKPPYSGYTLTKARILQDIPDLAIADEQPVTIGSDYIGLAFKSDNQAFDGASREVWFVFRGNLYQISTYARLDPLLQAIFTTWQFQ